MQANSRSVGAVMIAVIVVVLVTFLVIGWLQGDSTNHLEERQPSPSPSGSSAPALTAATDALSDVA